MPEELTSTPLAERVGCVARFNSVVDCIDAHLDAHLAERVRRRRLEVAASLLLASPPARVQVVALDTAFRGGCQPDDWPCIEVCGTDVVVDPETEVFSRELCLPVRPF
jgi:hypothetical protein